VQPTFRVELGVIIRGVVSVSEPSPRVLIISII